MNIDNTITLILFEKTVMYGGDKIINNFVWVKVMPLA